MTQKFHSTVAVVGLLVFAFSCGKPATDSKKTIAKVDGYVITEEDFRRSLSDSVYFHDITGVTLEEKKRFLDEQIKKELLIQTAIKEGLDKGEDFRQAIEKYWEQTLITFLVKKRFAELGKEILVTREEIEAHYREMIDKDIDAGTPKEDLMERIEKEIREEKETQAMARWVNDLKKKASITIFEENLKSLR